MTAAEPVVTVYTRSAGEKCQGCQATKRRLAKRGIAFDEIDVDEDPLTREALAYLGFSTVPVVLAATASGEQYWAGYRPDRIDALELPRIGASS